VDSGRGISLQTTPLLGARKQKPKCSKPLPSDNGLAALARVSENSCSDKTQRSGRRQPPSGRTTAIPTPSRNRHPPGPLPAGLRRFDFIHRRRNPRTALPPRPENFAVGAVLFQCVSLTPIHPSAVARIYRLGITLIGWADGRSTIPKPTGCRRQVFNSHHRLVRALIYSYPSRPPCRLELVCPEPSAMVGSPTAVDLPSHAVGIHGPASRRETCRRGRMPCTA
jgi:hypothetical protein